MVSHDNCTWTSGVCSVVYGLGEVRVFVGGGRRGKSVVGGGEGKGGVC